MYNSLKNCDMKVVLGDLNVKVGCENSYQHKTKRENKNQISNHNGRRVTEFAGEKELKIMSIHFKMKEMYKVLKPHTGTSYSHG